VDVDAEQCVRSRVGHPARNMRAPVAALDDVALRTKQLLHQRVHELGSSPRADDAGDRIGESKAGKRGNYDVVAGGCQRFKQPLELEERAWPAVEEEDGRLGAVALHMEEMEALAFDIGRKVG